MEIKWLLQSKFSILMEDKQLESTMVRYQDLLKIGSFENSEPMVAVDSTQILTQYQPEMNDMVEKWGTQMKVRNTVREKLMIVQTQLKEYNPNWSLILTYGYRTPEIQEMRFMKELARISREKYFKDPIDLYEEVHRYIAVPEVAGHPTGGAVDVGIIDAKSRKLIDFGSPMYVFSKISYTFNPNIPQIAQKNRRLLREIMMELGYAPFDGEWWHFSYGDKEWAQYYNKPQAIYSQIESFTPSST